jgi:hypothetical protein
MPIDDNCFRVYALCKKYACNETLTNTRSVRGAMSLVTYGRNALFERGGRGGVY